MKNQRLSWEGSGNEGERIISCSDGTITSYATVPGDMTMGLAAAIYMSTYDHNGEPGGLTLSLELWESYEDGADPDDTGDAEYSQSDLWQVVLDEGKQFDDGTATHGSLWIARCDDDDMRVFGARGEAVERVHEVLQPLCDEAQELYDAATGNWTGLDWTDMMGDPELGIDAGSFGSLDDYDEDERDGDGDNARDVAEFKVRSALRDLAERNWRGPGEYVEDEEEIQRQASEIVDEIIERRKAVAGDAQGSEDYAEEAIKALKNGQYKDAMDAAECAAHTESEYGDDPTWGQFARACEAIWDKFR